MRASTKEVDSEEEMHDGNSMINECCVMGRDVRLDGITAIVDSSILMLSICHPSTSISVFGARYNI